MQLVISLECLPNIQIIFGPSISIFLKSSFSGLPQTINIYFDFPKVRLALLIA